MTRPRRPKGPKRGGRQSPTEREAELLAMFDRAVEELTEEDRKEHLLFMRAHPNRD